MSPPIRLFRPLHHYLLAGVCCGALAALVWPWGQGPFSGVGFLAAAAAAPVFLGGMMLCLAVAATGAVQALPLLRYRERKALLDRLKADLDSPRRCERRLALQLIANHYGQPFGLVACWPVPFQSPVQVRNTILLYKEWLRISTDVVKGGALSPHVLRRLDTPGKVVVRDEFCEESSGLRERASVRTPPPLLPEDLTAAMRGPIELALRRTADVLNQAPPGRLVAAAEEQIRDLIADLLWDVLKTGLRLRMEAAIGAGEDPRPAPGSIGRAVEWVMECAADGVKDAILDLGVDDEEGSAPNPARLPLPPLAPGRLADALRGPVEGTVAAVAERVNAAPDLAGLEARQDEIRDLFDALAVRALELAAGLRIDAAAERLPWPAARGEWVKKYRRMAVMESLHDDRREGPAL